MYFTALLWHHWIFSEQLFQLRFTGVLHLNFTAKSFFVRKIETAFPKTSGDDTAA